MPINTHFKHGESQIQFIRTLNFTKIASIPPQMIPCLILLIEQQSHVLPVFLEPTFAVAHIAHSETFFLEGSLDSVPTLLRS